MAVVIALTQASPALAGGVVPGAKANDAAPTAQPAAQPAIAGGTIRMAGMTILHNEEVADLVRRITVCAGNPDACIQATDFLRAKLYDSVSPPKPPAPDKTATPAAANPATPAPAAKK
jgi:hypothetical protein